MPSLQAGEVESFHPLQGDFQAHDQDSKTDFSDWFAGEERKSLRKIASAKRILKELSEQYELIFKNSVFSSPSLEADRHQLFKARLIHLIAVTDGFEDHVGHSQLVAQYTLMLAKAMGVQDWNFLADIERGAVLHDIGKIGIPESILRKPYALSLAEREVIKEHPLLGYQIVQDYDFLERPSILVLFHHERFDGRGYPYGLKGAEIPLEARIFAVADALDAMTSDRPYRRGQGFRAAFDQISRESGAQFDPQAVDAFFSLPEYHWQQVKAETEARIWLHIVH